MTEPMTPSEIKQWWAEVSTLPEELAEHYGKAHNLLNQLAPGFKAIDARERLKAIVAALITSKKRVRELEAEADKLAGTIDQMWKDHDKEQELQTFLEKLER